MPRYAAVALLCLGVLVLGEEEPTYSKGDVVRVFAT
jgi:hypothetical protein